ncbi:uncharacterized protein PITG_13425 [Phytophthora infestans T30-4]|uniref:Uncharacterized protein n=1 Tax=Phytophthora infestans (strain T30-4) TaxID=403677 RepID=D0NLY8_PHYIT|nr:uncharacterized protein PITG_13425 [Phytophthora infestans T30-4]EEY60685.1 hypothetical protein PITG_13425 [Phytophthora infestans T30-4]|eukprot:XP_002900058.1 hypothetical protein PITG_13425 [Phytophthora infestans T30-4]
MYAVQNSMENENNGRSIGVHAYGRFIPTVDVLAYMTINNDDVLTFTTTDDGFVYMTTEKFETVSYTVFDILFNSSDMSGLYDLCVKPHAIFVDAFTMCDTHHPQRSSNPSCIIYFTSGPLSVVAPKKSDGVSPKSRRMLTNHRSNGP